MRTGQRIAVPTWQLRYEQALERIRLITKDHPLTELETTMLAEYADQAINTRKQDGVLQVTRDYQTIVDWLEATSRISPKEHNELLEVIKKS